MVQALKKLSLQSGRIGMEVGKNQKLFMPVMVYEGIRSELPDMDVVSSFTAVAQVRAIKSAEEVKCIRSACDITTQAVEYGLSIIQKGITEKEIYREVKKKMFELGADKIPFLTVIAGWEGRSICWDSLPTSYGGNLVLGQGQTGHGFGLGIHEAPFLSPQNQDHLEAGMVLAIEPVILEYSDIHRSSYFTILENDYVIKEDGYEQLTNSAEEIRIIPL